MTVIVDYDGLPFPEAGRDGDGDGLGLGLAKRLSIGGLLIMPPRGLKVFELRLAV